MELCSGYDQPDERCLRRLCLARDMGSVDSRDSLCFFFFPFSNLEAPSSIALNLNTFIVFSSDLAARSHIIPSDCSQF